MHDYGFEERFAKAIGGKVVPGSGNGKWAKSDVRGSSILWSCKATTNKSFSVTKSMLKEAAEYAKGICFPGMAIEVESEGVNQAYVIMTVEDFTELMSMEDEFIPTDKARAKKLAARTPARLR